MGDSAVVIATLNGGTHELGAAALQALRMSFRGPILTAGDPAYDETRAVWNAMADRKPAIIARCTGTADAIAIVRFCRDHQLLNSVRSGGHNVAGTGVCNGGVMIDMSLIKLVRRSGRAQGACAGGLRAR